MSWGARTQRFLKKQPPKKEKESEEGKKRNIKEQAKNEALSTCVLLTSMTSLSFKYGQYHEKEKIGWTETSTPYGTASKTLNIIRFFNWPSLLKVETIIHPILRYLSRLKHHMLKLTAYPLTRLFWCFHTSLICSMGI